MAYRKLSAAQLDKMWAKASAQHHAFARLVEDYVRTRLDPAMTDEPVGRDLERRPATKKAPSRKKVPARKRG